MVQHQAWRRSAGAEGAIVGLMRAKPSWWRVGGGEIGRGTGSVWGGPRLASISGAAGRIGPQQQVGKVGKYVITV